MKVEVSNGELLDKLTILELKMSNISDDKKLINVKKEFNELSPLAKLLFEKLFLNLKINYIHLHTLNPNKVFLGDSSPAFLEFGLIQLFQV